MSDLTNKVDPTVSDAAYYLLPTLNKEFKAMAQAATWPKEVIDQMEIQFDGEEIYISYPDGIAKQVVNLEYGNGSDRPNSVIRSFIYRVDPMIKRAIGSRLIENVIDDEGVFSV